MARLKDLPNETLLEIFSYVGLRPSISRYPQKADIYNMAITSRRFASLAQSILFEKVVFYPLDGDDFTHRFSQFCRSVDANPSLGLYVRDFETSFSLPNYGEPSITERNQSKVIELFKKLPGLRSLYVENRCYNEAYSHLNWDGFTAQFISRFLSQVPLKSLETVELYGGCLARAHVIYPFMAMRNIKTMGISTFRSTDSGTVVSQLREFRIDYGKYVNVDNLRKIVQMAPQLQKLCLGWPFPPSGKKNLSPAAVKYSLEPVMSSLVELKMAGLGEFPKHHDKSVLDLSGFTSLKVVQVPSSCLFTSAYRNESRDILFRRLPSSLEELKITFENDSRILESEPNAFTFEFGQKDYDWILKLATSKKSMFPFLHSIRLEQVRQRYSSSFGQYFLCWEIPDGFMVNSLQCEVNDENGELVDSWVNPEKWRIPDVLATTLQEANISFFAQLNAPRATKGAISIRKR